MEAPINRLAMLTDYVDPDERSVACPNQDVVYGIGALALDVSPVVIQVPDFGDRFWVYQVVDLAHRQLRSDRQDVRHHAGLLSAGRADWKGEVPKGITKVFRSPTNTGIAAPRVAQNDTPEDKRAIQYRAAGHRDVSAVRIRRHDEDERLGRSAQGARASVRRRGDAMGDPGQVR